MNEKRTYEPAEIKIVKLDRDMLNVSGERLTENSSLDKDEWGFITFGNWD